MSVWLTRDVKASTALVYRDVNCPRDWFTVRRVPVHRRRIGLPCCTASCRWHRTRFLSIRTLRRLTVFILQAVDRIGFVVFFCPPGFEHSFTLFFFVCLFVVLLLGVVQLCTYIVNSAKKAKKGKEKDKEPKDKKRDKKVGGKRNKNAARYTSRSSNE